VKYAIVAIIGSALQVILLLLLQYLHLMTAVDSVVLVESEVHKVMRLLLASVSIFHHHCLSLSV